MVGTIMKKIIFIYSTYKDDEIATPLVTQLSWTNNLLILSGAKNKEERHFYLKLSIKNNYSKREFKAEYLRKMNLYLEALDREVEKEQENPSVGVILCSSKDEDVVEYSISKNMSQTMIYEYKLKLIDKKWGIKNKIELLRIEGNDMSKYYVQKRGVMYYDKV